MQSRRLATLLLTLSVSGTVFAQSLHALAPADALLALEATADAGFPTAVADELAALPWTEGGVTLQRLLGALGGDLDDVGEVGEMLGDLPAIAADVGEICPAAAEVLLGVDPFALVDDGLVTLSLDPMAPVPALAFLARAVDPGALAAVQDALIGCFGGPVFSQDGVALTVLGDGGDLPLVVGRVDTVFFASTDPNVARGIVRRALGASEPSLATAPLGEALARLEPGGLGIGVDVAALAGFAPLIAGQVPPELAPLVDRAVAAITTLGVSAARVGWSADGLLLSSVHAWPADAPDSELGALIGHTRAAPALPAAPEGASAVGSAVFPIHDVIAYVDGWLLDLAPLTGAPLDLRTLFSGFLGLDLDRLLLGWIGDEFTVIELAPPSTDLRYWIGGAPTVVSIALTDPALAVEGIDELGASLLGLIEGITALAADPSLSPLGSDGAALGGLVGEAVVTTSVVAGVSVDRVRLGSALDLGVALVGDRLLIGTPWHALSDLLEHRASGGTNRSDAAWNAAVAALPVGARDLMLSDTAAVFRGLADVADLASQPLAGLLAAIPPLDGGDDDWDDFGSFDDEALTPPSTFGMLPGDFDPATATAEPLFLGGYVESELTDASLHQRYALEGLPVGAVVTVEMLDLDSWLDTYLYVFDGDTGTLLFENDDAGTTERSFVAFVVEPGVNYHVLASSYGGYGVGDYSLFVSERFGDVADPDLEADDTVAMPTFPELLALTDLLPRALSILADHAGIASSVTTVDGNAAITRVLIPLR